MQSIDICLRSHTLINSASKTYTNDTSTKQACKYRTKDREKEERVERERERQGEGGERQSFCNSLINPLYAAGRFLHFLKTSENPS